MVRPTAGQCQAWNRIIQALWGVSPTALGLRMALEQTDSVTKVAKSAPECG